MDRLRCVLLVLCVQLSWTQIHTLDPGNAGARVKPGNINEIMSLFYLQFVIKDSIMEIYCQIIEVQCHEFGRPDLPGSVSLYCVLISIRKLSMSFFQEV